MPTWRWHELRKVSPNLRISGLIRRASPVFRCIADRAETAERFSFALAQRKEIGPVSGAGTVPTSLSACRTAMYEYGLHPRPGFITDCVA